MRIAQLISTAAVFAATAGFAHAQSTAAAGSVVVVPAVAATASYSTEVIVRNPNSSAMTVNVSFYEAIESGSPGLHSCTPLSIPANEPVPFTLATQCALGGGGHFGMVVLEDAGTPQTHPFFAYSRAQTPGGNGFSVEGFPIGAFSGAVADVDGLKRQASSPTYQSNCFIGALSEGFSYQITLWDATNHLVGLPITGTLAPFQNSRKLDVFAVAGAAAGDHAHVRANFSITSGGAPAMLAFCTVQESTFFGADFRIAKSIDALNDGQRRVACIGQDDCNGTAVSATQPETVADATLRNVYSMIVTQPDFLRCDIVAAAGDLPNLKMRLRFPGDPFSSTVVPGSSGAQSFYIFTGGRNAVNNGVASRWFIDVETATNSTSVPIDFGVNCKSGNGTEIPWFRGTAARF